MEGEGVQQQAHLQEGQRATGRQTENRGRRETVGPGRERLELGPSVYKYSESSTRGTLLGYRGT